MIKYNLKDINDWNFDGSNVAKVYRNGAVVYYKLSGESPTPEYQVCFAVVDDITQYSEREFEDVYDKATEKWFKLNNLNQYEQYGIYGDGKNITYYEGKLTVDDGYEYEWNGSSWVNLGEVSGSSKTSDFKIGDIKERVTTGVSNGDYLLFSYYNSSDISKPENIMSYNPSNNYLSNLSGYGITTLDSTTIIDPSIWLLESTASANTFYIKSIKNNLYWGYQSKVSTRSLNLVDSSSSQKTPVLITPSCKENCYGFVEKKSNASTGYGGYGLNQLNSYTYQLNWWNYGSSNVPCTFFDTDGNADFIIYKMNANSAEYPKYYSEKSEPLNNLTFNTLAEAQTYARNNCVYDGLKATINGDRYKFVTDEGWVENGGGLPDVPFVLNYNAKQYNSSTKTLLKTEGQLANVNAVITAKTPTLHDEYLTITLGTRATISGYQNYFNRDNNNPNLTIISKQRTDGNNCHMFANRDSNYNWMYRCYSNRLVLHGSSEQGSLTVTAQPVIESVRVNSNRLLTYNNYTDNTSSTQSNFNYGGTNSGNFALFAGYATNTMEWFVGDFYWIYMCQGTLTDDQVQQVIDYNENL